MLTDHHQAYNKDKLISLAYELYDFMDTIKNDQEEKSLKSLNLLMKYGYQELFERKQKKYADSLTNDF
jgi:hypothetical protein